MEGKVIGISVVAELSKAVSYSSDGETEYWLYSNLSRYYLVPRPRRIVVNPYQVRELPGHFSLYYYKDSSMRGNGDVRPLV